MGPRWLNLGPGLYETAASPYPHGCSAQTSKPGLTITTTIFGSHSVRNAPQPCQKRRNLSLPRIRIARRTHPHLRPSKHAATGPPRHTFGAPRRIQRGTRRKRVSSAPSSPRITNAQRAHRATVAVPVVFESRTSSPTEPGDKWSQRETTGATRKALEAIRTGALLFSLFLGVDGVRQPISCLTISTSTLILRHGKCLIRSSYLCPR